MGLDANVLASCAKKCQAPRRTRGAIDGQRSVPSLDREEVDGLCLRESVALLLDVRVALLFSTFALFHFPFVLVPLQSGLEVIREACCVHG